MLPLPLLDVARLTVAAHSPGPLTARVAALVAWLSVSARQQLCVVVVCTSDFESQ